MAPPGDLQSPRFRLQGSAPLSQPLSQRAFVASWMQSCRTSSSRTCEDEQSAPLPLPKAAKALSPWLLFACHIPGTVGVLAETA